MKKHLYAILAFLTALAVRLYPTFLSGLPFSTDAWSPVRNTELLLEHTPINLDNEIMDGYNCYWPANSLFGAVFSLATGLKPMVAMAVGVPLAGALTILIFYALISEISRSSKLAFSASILLATAYPYALFTAGVTKETYANPLYVLSILIFLSRGKWRKILLFTTTSAALVLAHHLTALVTIAVLTSITLATSISRVRRGLSLNKLGFLLTLILTIATTLYFGLYAYRGLKITLTLSDWLSAGSYQLVAFATALYFTSKPHMRSHIRTILTCSAAVALIAMIALLCTKRSIIPGAPRLPSHYLLYASPFILASPLTVLGFWELNGTHTRGERHVAPLFWFATILGLVGYAVFGDSPFGLTLAYRSLNFLHLPLVILCASGIHRLFLTSGKPHTQKLTSLMAATALLLIVALTSYSVYAAVSLQERYMGYFWLYKIPEYEAAEWAATTVHNLAVAGDVKVSYLLKGYFNVDVDVLQGLRYLGGNGGSNPQILFIYDQMLRNGYVLYGGYSIDLPENWMEKASQLNLIYSNGAASLYTS